MPRERHSAHYTRTDLAVPCPGRHNDRWRYAVPEDPDVHEREGFAPGDPFWCRDCADAIRATLLYLPRLAAALHLEIENATDPKAEAVSGSRTRALHAHQQQALLINAIFDTLTQWEDDTRDYRALTPRRRDVTQGAAISNATVFLVAHLTWILTRQTDTQFATGEVRSFADRIHTLEKRAMTLTHQDEAVPISCVGVRCDACTLKTLVHAVHKSGAATGEIVCENCGKQFTLEEYRHLAHDDAAAEHAALTDEDREELGATLVVYEHTTGIADTGLEPRSKLVDDYERSLRQLARGPADSP
jgi:hypothetical protein